MTPVISSNTVQDQKLRDLRQAGYNLTYASVNTSTVVYTGQFCTVTYGLGKLNGTYRLVATKHDA